MRIRNLIAAALVFACVTPIMADKRADAKAQVEFGILVAKRGLWKEAAYRWKLAVGIDENYAAAWNDLAIAYEQLGQLSSARDAYERALKLANGDATVTQNYDMFKEVYERQQVRRNGK
jgi:Tfp pilus assembly protein PilF